MTHWNHRVIKRTYLTPEGREDQYSIHEVFYDDNGDPGSCTERPVGVVGDSWDDLALTLEKMLDCMAKPTLDYRTFAEKELSP